jgi:hypothetical protein
MDITADGSIRGNNYIACRNFLTSENSLINGNVFIGCARLSVDGRLDGNLYAGASELIINNEIKGDVSFKGRQISLVIMVKLTEIFPTLPERNSVRKISQR